MDVILREKILEEIKPTSLEHEEFESNVKKLKGKLSRASKKLGISCLSVCLCVSVCVCV